MPFGFPSEKAFSFAGIPIPSHRPSIRRAWIEPDALNCTEISSGYRASSESRES
jgi:hypothetical protein